jgi:hypothetical protein
VILNREPNHEMLAMQRADDAGTLFRLLSSVPCVEMH